MNTVSILKSSISSTLLVVGVVLGLTIVAAVYADAPAPVAHSDGLVATLDDTAITAKVKSKFMGESALKDSHISVTTTNGVVTLTGTATGLKAKSLAESHAKMVEGVKSVDTSVLVVRT